MIHISFPPTEFLRSLLREQGVEPTLYIPTTGFVWMAGRGTAGVGKEGKRKVEGGEEMPSVGIEQMEVEMAGCRRTEGIVEEGGRSGEGQGKIGMGVKGAREAEGIEEDRREVPVGTDKTSAERGMERLVGKVTRLREDREGRRRRRERGQAEGAGERGLAEGSKGDLNTVLNKEGVAYGGKAIIASMEEGELKSGEELSGLEEMEDKTSVGLRLGRWRRARKGKGWSAEVQRWMRVEGGDKGKR